MRLIFGVSASLTSTECPSFFFRFFDFDVRMWRKCECPRITFPVAVFLKRFAAPLCVFNFGIFPRRSYQLSAVSYQLKILSSRLRGCLRLLSGIFLRSQDGVERIALLPGTKLYNTFVLDVFYQTLQNLAS